jgi:predicted nuclease of predicted toxin-antitoxin system
MVRFLADECFSGALVRALRDDGFDVIRSADTLPSAPDEQVLQLAHTTNRVLLTEDNDFGDLVIRLGLPTRGVVRVDLKLLEKASQVKRLRDAVTQLGDKILNALVTIEPTRTRVRKL